MARARRFTSSSSARQSINRRTGRSSCHAARPETGGRYDNIFVSSGLDTKLKQVAAELTGQYRVTYARPQSLIPPERVKIETTRDQGDRARHSRERAQSTFPGTAMRSRLLRARTVVAAAAGAALVSSLTVGAAQQDAPTPQQPTGSACITRPALPCRRRPRVAERHGQRKRHPALRHRPQCRRISGVRGRRQAGRHLLHTREPADRALRADRHQRQHGLAPSDGTGSGHWLRAQAPRSRISPRSSTSTAAW